MLVLAGDNAQRLASRDVQARVWHGEHTSYELGVLFDHVAAFEQILRRTPVLPEAAAPADIVLHDLLPDAYQTLRAGATLISLGLYVPALRMARPLSE